MRRTNVYLSDEQLDTLRRIGTLRAQPVAELVREAVDYWLQAQGVRSLPADELERRFDALLARRRQAAREQAFEPAEVERDVMQAVREVRKARAARRR
jgi:hypothetical protein